MKTTETWADRIAQAEKTGEFTQRDVTDAENWEADPTHEFDIPREATHNGSVPKDEEMYWLGLQFYLAVNRNFVREARSIYVDMSKRARQITGGVHTGLATKQVPADDSIIDDDDDGSDDPNVYDANSIAEYTTEQVGSERGDEQGGKQGDDDDLDLSAWMAE